MNQETFLPESLMMTYGYNAMEHQGAVKCPLYQTSTFAFKSAEHGKAFFEIAYGLKEKKQNEEPGMIYSRLNNPNLQIIEKRLAKFEHAADCAFFSSGMAAISTTFLSFLKPGDLLLYSMPLYGGTDYLINHILPQMGIDAVCFTGKEKLEDIVEKVHNLYPRRKPRMVYAESPGNPTNGLIDFDLLNHLCNYYNHEQNNCISVVDNTYLGPVFQHPLQFGIHLVVYSATKFIGGHSDVLAGAVVGNEKLVGAVKTMRTFLGSPLDPHSAWLIARSLETLKIRMVQQAKTACKVAAHLKAHPLVKKIHYLEYSQPETQQYQLYKKQCLSAGSMIAFEIEGGEAEAFCFLNNLSLFKLAVSLGSTESLAEHPATMTHCDVSEPDRLKAGITSSLVRLSIGLENARDLICDIENAFAAVKKMKAASQGLKIEH